MKDLIIIANWKENKTKDETMDWFKGFQEEGIDIGNKEVIVCPPFTLLAKVNYLVSEDNLSIKIGAQDVSQFETGAYTGEVSALQIKEFAEYVIIGHSERRKNFNENDSLLAQKVSVSVSQGIVPIFCISDPDMNIPQEVRIVAYEPIDAIGTGNPDSPEDAEDVAKKIKEKNNNVEKVLYGGSVTPENVKSFVVMENIDGVLVGGESLDASSFLKIVKNA